MYRLYRHPVVLFVMGPSYLFILQNRLPLGLMNAGWRYWTSAMGTNAMIGIALGLIVWFGGLMPVLLIFLPTSVIAATIGVWLFYVQHQFEETHWSRGEDGSCMMPPLRAARIMCCRSRYAGCRATSASTMCTTSIQVLKR